MPIFSEDHSLIATSSFLNIPSPEQGASTNIRSKKLGRELKSLGSLFVTTELGLPNFTIFSERILARWRIISLLTKRLPLGKDESKLIDLPPGAAHKSRQFTGSATSCLTTCSINIEDAS